MIKIFIDSHRLKKDEQRDLAVSDENSYIESRVKIREALRNNRNATIIIQSRKFSAWYESLRGDANVEIVEISPTSCLAEKLKINPFLIPLKDSDIIELGLVEIVERTPPTFMLTQQTDLRNWILSVCIDKCWGETVTNLAHFSELCSYFLGGADKRPSDSADRLMKERISEWKASDLDGVYTWLLDGGSPVKKAFLTYVLQIMRKYDETMIKKILKRINADANTINFIIKYIDSIPMIDCVDNFPEKIKLNDIIEREWRNSLDGQFQYKMSEIKNDKDVLLKTRFQEIIRGAMVRVSGEIEGELNAFIYFIKDKPIYLDESLFDLINAVFSKFKEQIEELKKLVPPKFPSSPSLNWTWEEMSGWVIEEYFPYVKWMFKNYRIDRTIKEYSDMYSFWLYKNYPILKNEPLPLNYGTWVQIKKLVSEGYNVLWIIIDNLCWFYVDYVKDALKKAGFTISPPTGIVPMLSMLPSETKTSKTALVAGRLPCQIDPNTNYEQLLADACQKNSIIKHVLIEDTALKKEQLRNNQLTCCIINKLDFRSHKSDFDLEDDIKDSLARWVGYIKDFVMRGAKCDEITPKKVKIIISTDHGSCLIPLASKGHKNPQGAKSDGEGNSRFISIDSKNSLDENWFYLEKESFGLRENMALIRGYAFVGKRKPQGLVHGSMTPEETIIPHIEFCLEPVEIKPIECHHISDPVYISPRKQKVTFSIINPNAYEIKDVKVFIPVYNIELAAKRILTNDEIYEESSIIIEKEKTMVGKNNTASLDGYYQFSYLGDKQSGKLRIQLKIKRLMEGYTDVEELLGLRGGMNDRI